MSTGTFEITQKPAFMHGLRALPPKHQLQVFDKISLLMADPWPDGKLKKKLHGYATDVYRLRSGDYRILYCIGPDWVALLTVDARKDVYQGMEVEAEEPRASALARQSLDAILERPAPARAGASTTGTTPGGVTPSEAEELLTTTLDEDLLRRLRVPEEYISILSVCRTVDDLIAAAVPDTLRERLFDVATAPDIDRVLGQPSLVVQGVDDLVRFAEGELISFLLQLSLEQERFVTWAMDAGGPTLVKGGPGTGKSTVALRRVRAMLESLRKAGTDRPRILFTTYTNALTLSSRQQLHSLLGTDAALVDVRTADSLVMDVAPEGAPIGEESQIIAVLTQAVAGTAFEGNSLARRAQTETIGRLGPRYVLDEINTVIEGRQIATLDTYLATPRHGRAVRLNAMQRTAVWQVRQTFVTRMAEAGLQTWSQQRRRAAEAVATGRGLAPYDAVIVDEAQDLEPTVLRVLVGLCRAPNRLFVTADANQSVYGSGFRWSDIHEELRFGGRTGVLRVNYRSTRQIGEAARSYLGAGALDAGTADELPVTAATTLPGATVAGGEYVHEGPDPAARVVDSGFDEAQLLARYFPGAAHAFRLGLDGCALLVPTEQRGKELAAYLVELGVEAAFMSGRELDLTRRCVKVITLKSAKGLEFPVVALAGFVGTRYPTFAPQTPPEERDDLTRRERRTMYVGMTRAMRALLVVVPDKGGSSLMQGFEAGRWNLGA